MLFTPQEILNLMKGEKVMLCTKNNPIIMEMHSIDALKEALHSKHKDKAILISITQKPNNTTSRNSVPKIPTKLVNHHHNKHFHQRPKLMSTNCNEFSKKSKVTK